MNAPDTSLTIDLHDLPAEQAVGRLIDLAAARQASDVLFASNENHVAVSMRHLGIHRLATIMPADQGRACIGHIKAVAGIDFAEHRRPLDGRWLRAGDDGHRIDLRISVLPTLRGEDLNLRFLNRQCQFLGLDRLGMAEPTHRLMLDILDSPSGLILVTGPTGSGKSTTQYALLHRLNNGQRKINTIEDPIEYELAGIRQAQVNHHLELGFPELLRAVLRQAPDVIMLGEIRDPATAETAIRAAASGHLVLATLHAPGAAAAIVSLQALGVSPHFLGMSLRSIVAQRLVRTLCPRCRAPDEGEPWPGLFDEAASLRTPDAPRQVFEERGCPECNQTGYAGRTGIFELMNVSDALRHFVYERRTSGETYRQALAEGMISFRKAAALRIAEGDTSAAEIRRVLPREFLLS